MDLVWSPASCSFLPSSLLTVGLTRLCREPDQGTSMDEHISFCCLCIILLSFSLVQPAAWLANAISMNEIHTVGGMKKHCSFDNSLFTLI